MAHGVGVGVDDGNWNAIEYSNKLRFLWPRIVVRQNCHWWLVLVMHVVDEVSDWDTHAHLWLLWIEEELSGRKSSTQVEELKIAANRKTDVKFRQFCCSHVCFFVLARSQRESENLYPRNKNRKYQINLRWHHRYCGHVLIILFKGRCHERFCWHS